jgi:hypothetical protein
LGYTYGVQQWAALTLIMLSMYGKYSVKKYRTETIINYQVSPVEFSIMIFSILLFVLLRPSPLPSLLLWANYLE